MENKKILIIKLMTKMSQLIGHKQNEDKLKMYAVKLMQYDLSKIKFAFSQVIYNHKFFPTYLEIESYINPKESEQEQIDMIFSDLIEIASNAISYVDFLKQFSKAHTLAAQKYGKWNDLTKCKVDKYFLEKACRAAVKEINREFKKNELKNYIENEKAKQLECNAK